MNESDEPIFNDILQVLERIEKCLADPKDTMKSRYLYCLDADTAAAEAILASLNIQYTSGRAPLNAAAAVAEYVLQCSEDQYTALQAKLFEDLPAAVVSRDRPAVILPVA